MFIQRNIKEEGGFLNVSMCNLAHLPNQIGKGRKNSSQVL
jgi:hypothetical protein